MSNHRIPNKNLNEEKKNIHKGIPDLDHKKNPEDFLMKKSPQKNVPIDIHNRILLVLKNP